MGREVLVLGGDLSNRADRQAWIDKVHAQTDVLDVLVNNAAIYETLPFGQISYEDWDRMLGVNLEAPFFITQGLLPLLKASTHASVINITDSGLDWPGPE